GAVTLIGGFSPLAPGVTTSADPFKDEQTVATGRRRISPSSTPPAPDGTPRGPRRAWPLGVGLLALGVLAWVLFAGRPGSLVVTLTAPDDADLSSLKIWVDERMTCQSSPCRLAELEAGAHFVRAAVDGYPDVARQAVVVVARQETTHSIELAGLARARLVDTGTLPNMTVAIDGTTRSSSPFNVELAPGKHVLEASGEGLNTITETVELAPGEEREVGPLRPGLLQGRLRIESKDQVAVAVTLDAERIKLPYDQLVDATVPHRLVAWRTG